MATKAKDKRPVRDMMVEFVGIINKDPGRAEYVRQRVPELMAEPFPDQPGDNRLQVAIFKAAAEYHAKDQKPRTEFAACPNQCHRINPGEFPPQTRYSLPCGRAARIYRSAVDDKPDMAYCEHCMRWFIVKADTPHTVPEPEPERLDYDWFNY